MNCTTVLIHYGIFVLDFSRHLGGHMKIEFQYNGDVHEFVMAMLGGQTHTLTSESGKPLVVRSVIGNKTAVPSVIMYHSNVNSEVIMSIPVTLPELGGSGVMTFQYDVKSALLAKAVPKVEEVPDKPDDSDPDGHLIMEEKGHPAIEGHPEIRVKKFQPSVLSHRDITKITIE